MRISVNEGTCLLGHGQECKNCVLSCPMHVLGIREERIKVLRPEACIACHCCKGSCPAGLETIEIERPPLGKKDIQEYIPVWEGLAVQVGQLTLRTPLVVASGPVSRCGHGWFRASAVGCGAVVTKTTTPLPWPGNQAIRLLPYEKELLLNCEGLPNLGAELTAREVKIAKALDSRLKVIPSITAFTKEEFVDMARLLEDAGGDGLEIALMGCPNYRPGTVISQGYWIEDAGRVFELVDAVRKAVNLPIWVKGAQKPEVARACEEAGADALLVRSGSLRAMPLNPTTGKPVLSHPRGEGSLTGPYTKLPGLKVVSDMARQVKIPIIGNGGITCGQDVIDYVRAGATAVELLTVLIRRGMSVVPKILSEVESLVTKQGYAHLKEIRGESLQYLP